MRSKNLCQVAAALGAGATLSGAFDESVLARLLQVDEREEGVLAQVLLHAGPVQLRQLAPAWLPAPMTDDLGIGITGTLHQGRRVARGRRSGRSTPWRRCLSVAIRCR
jgi:hypothetical protein